MVTVTVPENILQRLKKEAEEKGISLEDYIIDLLTQSLDPKERAEEYAKASSELLKEAEEELKKDNIRQAAEKVWGSVALAIKAYAYWKEGKRLSSHKELWDYSEVVAKDLGEWILDAWNEANAMHTCFYEGWCKKAHVESAIRTTKKLIESVYVKILGNSF